jgi:hypothetical protein
MGLLALIGFSDSSPVASSTCSSSPCFSGLAKIVSQQNTYTHTHMFLYLVWTSYGWGRPSVRQFLESTACLYRRCDVPHDPGLFLSMLTNFNSLCYCCDFVASCVANIAPVCVGKNPYFLHCKLSRILYRAIERISPEEGAQIDACTLFIQRLCKNQK